MTHFIRRLRQFVGIKIRSLRVSYLRIFGGRHVSIGKNNNISLGAWLDLSGGFLKTGDRCTIARGAIILAHDASQQWRGNPELYRSETIIGDNVFVGMNAIILPGVIIGDNVIIGAGSVVTKNIPSGSIACGNPAKVIREDFVYQFRQ
ncbi:MAG: acyltransferase [Desulfobulbaceae bacterium]|nr:acyltransferase [Desulfobulbaceae bacterium]